MSYFVKTALSVLIVLFGGGNLYAQTIHTPLLSDLDIPLMPGFEEQEGSRVVFDTPQGRIIEVQASGPHGTDAVLDYYKVVLPSLSWVTVAQKANNCNDDAFVCIMARREGEILTLRISERKQPLPKTIIYFSVNPE